MNVSFKILWFEDEFAWFQMEQMRINEILQEHNLKPDITRKDGDSFNIDELLGNEYDLILMDFILADGNTGDIIVSAIRENDILTDILFYSSHEVEMLSAVSNNTPPIDGVYFTKRDYQVFTNKVHGLINKIVRRSEDVVNLRGFVLDNTSDFELRIRELLNICWEKLDTQMQEQINNKLVDLLDSKVDHTSKQVNSAKSATIPFSYANNDDYLLSMADRLAILQEALSILAGSYKMPITSTTRSFISFYYDTIGTYRNKLGHLKVGDTTIKVNGQDILIDQALHRRLRGNIDLVDSEIRSLEEFVTRRM